MNKQQLASKIWESANRMRSKIEAHEYKDYILGFMFYKYLSDTEIKYVYDQGGTAEDIKALSEDDSSTVSNFQNNIGYFIAHKNLFTTWIEKGREFNVSDVSEALNAFSRHTNPTHKKVFNRIFDTLETGLSKLGETTGTRTRAISDLIQLIKVIPMDSKQDYDVLGFIYEYLIGMFAANAGKKAGEFYTPHEVSLLVSEIVANHVKDKPEIKLYDSTSGSGSLLINIGKSVAKHVANVNNIKYYAQELKENTYNLTRMNLVMRGILPDNIVTRNGDTLEDDWPYFDDEDPANTYDPLYVDAVVSNPPYSQAWDTTNKDSDARFSVYGVAPKTKADYAFLLHDLFHLKPDGIMAIVLPHGVLFRGGEEEKIRKKLIELNQIDAIIGLPANIFFGTGIPTIIMVLKKRRVNTDVLVIDASKGFVKVGKNNVLRASDIKKIADTVHSRASVEKFSRAVSQDEIRTNDYNLNIPRYVDSSDEPETWDIYASMFGGIPVAEIAALDDFWQTFVGLKEVLFTDTGTPYSAPADVDVGKAIREDQSVLAWKKEYEQTFGDFPSLLKERLLDGWKTVDTNRQEAILSDDVFTRLDTVSLVDKYKAYQALHDKWITIAVDLEILQTEGFDAAKRVDPNLIIKKKNGVEQEIQDGWVGHVIPFELAQSAYMSTEASALREKEERLAEIQATYSDIIETLSEEEKGSDILNDKNDAFVSKAVGKYIKDTFGSLAKAKTAVKSCDDDSLEKKIVNVKELMDEEKNLKKSIKADSANLHMRTKTIIEELTDEQAKELLEAKWIEPLMSAFWKIPDTIITNLVTRVQTLSNKYAVTYSDVTTRIEEVENSLSSMIDGLVGGEFDIKGLHKFRSLIRGENTWDIKNAVREKMFPYNGTDIPEVRFSEFTSPWKRQKLGDVAEIVRGASPRPIKEPKWFDENSDIGWLRISDVTEQNGRVRFLEQRLSEAGQKKTRVLTEPHLLLSIAATVGKPVINYVKTGVHDGFLIFQNLVLDREFLFQWLEMFRTRWSRYGQPGSQVNLNSDLVKNNTLMVPEITEQKRIGDFLAKFDDLISLHALKLGKLQNMRSSLLNKMFI